jgi:hypothetical protein
MENRHPAGHMEAPEAPPILGKLEQAGEPGPVASRAPESHRPVICGPPAANQVVGNDTLTSQPITEVERASLNPRQDASRTEVVASAWRSDTGLLDPLETIGRRTLASNLHRCSVHAFAAEAARVQLPMCVRAGNNCAAQWSHLARTEAWSPPPPPLPFLRRHGRFWCLTLSSIAPSTCLPQERRAAIVDPLCVLNDFPRMTRHGIL